MDTWLVVTCALAGAYLVSRLTRTPPKGSSDPETTTPLPDIPTPGLLVPLPPMIEEALGPDLTNALLAATDATIPSLQPDIVAPGAARATLELADGEDVSLGKTLVERLNRAAGWDGGNSMPRWHLGWASATKRAAADTSIFYEVSFMIYDRIKATTYHLLASVVSPAGVVPRRLFVAALRPVELSAMALR